MDIETGNRSGAASVGLIIRQKEPNNLEMPFDQLGDFITPSELFYIRSHFPRRSWIAPPGGCRYVAQCAENSA